MAKNHDNLAPYILVVGTISDPVQAFLVVDRQIVMDVDFDNIPLTLMSAFFLFNIHYPKGCTNFYAFMEVYTLAFPISKASPTVKHFITGLYNAD